MKLRTQNIARGTRRDTVVDMHTEVLPCNQAHLKDECFAL